MKAGAVILAFLLATSWTVAATATANPAATVTITTPVTATAVDAPGWEGTSNSNRVLRLDGLGSYVELPANLLAGLDQVTIEGWIRWRRLGDWSRFFEVGERHRSLVVQLGAGSPHLDCALSFGSTDTYRHVTVRNCVRTQAWYHCAVVAGRENLEFYVNGIRAGALTNTGFGAIPRSGRIQLGRCTWSTNAVPGGNRDSDADLDDLRVWNRARSAEEIRVGMFRRVCEATRKGWSRGGLSTIATDSGGWDGSGHGNAGVLRGKAAGAGGGLACARETSGPAPGWAGSSGIPRGCRWRGFRSRRGGARRSWRKRRATARAGSGYPRSRGRAWSISGPWRANGRSARRWSCASASEEREVELQLVPSAGVSGTVWALDGATPLASVVVQLLSVEPGEAVFVAAALTDSHGALYGSSPYLRGSIGCAATSWAGSWITGAGKASSWHRVREGAGCGISNRSVQEGGVAVVPELRTPADAGHGTVLSRLRRTSPRRSECQVGRGRLAGIGLLHQDRARSPSGRPDWDGLFRFDEREFVRYREAEGFEDLGFSALADGPDGTLWVGTYQGLYRYDPDSEARGGKAFVRLPAPAGNLSVSAASLRVEADGGYWVGTSAEGVWHHDGQELRQVDPEVQHGRTPSCVIPNWG
jgi:hypothetical protein